MYEPKLGRFTTRDPLPQAGMVVLGGLSPAAQAALLQQYAYAENNPVNRIDPSGLISCYCGEAAAQAYAVGPIDALTARRLAMEALALAQKEAPGLPGGMAGLHNGAADAFRHCYWSCRMAQEIGAKQAKSVGDVHEACSKGPATEEAMDQANNAYGRSIGVRGNDCRGICLLGVGNGSLQTSVGGKPPRVGGYY